MDRADIPYWRLHNLRITASPLDSAEEVVRWLGAVQSQDYPGGKWSIGHRTHGLADADLDQAFEQGALLRTHFRSVMHGSKDFMIDREIQRNDEGIAACTGSRTSTCRAPPHNRSAV